MIRIILEDKRILHTLAELIAEIEGCGEFIIKKDKNREATLEKK